MTIKKQHLKTKPICRTTFRIPEEAFPNAEKAHLVGDFNGWDKTATPMKKLKSGAFSVTVDLAKDQEFQFRYLIDDGNWQNEAEADKTAPTEFGGEENSVVVT